MGRCGRIGLRRLLGRALATGVSSLVPHPCFRAALWRRGRRTNCCWPPPVDLAKAIAGSNAHANGLRYPIPPLRHAMDARRHVAQPRQEGLDPPSHLDPPCANRSACNANTPTDVTFSFTGFARRAGHTADHTGRLGIAFFEGRSRYFAVDHERAVDSTGG